MPAPVVMGAGAVLAGLFGLILLFHVTKTTEIYMIVIAAVLIAYMYYG